MGHTYQHIATFRWPFGHQDSTDVLRPRATKCTSYWWKALWVKAWYMAGWQKDSHMYIICIEVYIIYICVYIYMCVYIYICSKLFSHHLGNLPGQSQANPGVFDLKPKGFKGFVFHQLATSRWPVQACWTFGAKPCCWTPLHCICSVTGKAGPFLGRISVPSDEMAGRFAIKWGIPNGLWWCLLMI